jgi:hypothetical protein
VASDLSEEWYGGVEDSYLRAATAHLENDGTEK